MNLSGQKRDIQVPICNADFASAMENTRMNSRDLKGLS